MVFSYVPLGYVSQLVTGKAGGRITSARIDVYKVVREI